jgi:hypothetical protein
MRSTSAPNPASHLSGSMLNVAVSAALFFVFTTNDDPALTAPTSANTPHPDLQL